MWEGLRLYDGRVFRLKQHLDRLFKGAELQLQPGEAATVRKTISLAQHSTRTHYAGMHLAEIQCNGVIGIGREFSLST